MHSSSINAQSFQNGEAALTEGSWVKLICGASNQDLPSISDLCAVFSAAGVHCIDVAADIAVVNAARIGLDWVQSRKGVRPWLMVSLSDGRDIHFRKATFNSRLCPADCPRPCQRICPTKAIQENGINESLCYGCGRCLPVCPIGLILEEDKHLSPKDYGLLIKEIQPDAVEIHTAPGRSKSFESTISELAKAKVPLHRIGVSCGPEGKKISPEELAKELWLRYECLQKYDQKPLWQLDGRPMSGDLGGSSSKLCVSLWQKIHPIAPPGPIQLAGGTNAKTIEYVAKEDGPQGIAFGGMARMLIQPFLIEAQNREVSLRDWPEGWSQAVAQAKQLIQPWLDRKYRKN